MPRRTRKFKRRSTRRFSRRAIRRPVRKRRSIRRIPLQWPKSRMVKLRYIDVDTPDLTLTVGILGGQVTNSYKVNSAFDVNSAVLSTNMPGFVELASMYQNYRVMASKVTTRFQQSNAAANTPPITVGIHYNVGPLGVLANWSEYRRLWMANPNTRHTALTQDIPKVVSKYVRHARLLGDPRQYNADDNWQAAVLANPSSLIYCYVFAQTNDPTTFNLKIFANTSITMWIHFFNKDNEIF